MDKSRINGNCAYTYLAANIYCPRTKMSMPLHHAFSCEYNRNGNIKINSRAIFQWKRFHANIRANNIWQNVSWRINAVPDSSNIAPRRFTNFSRARTWSFHSDRKADKLSSLNDDTVLRTGDLLMRNRREDRTMATREINFQFVGGGHARKLHFCIVSRAAIGDTHETKGVS